LQAARCDPDAGTIFAEAGALASLLQAEEARDSLWSLAKEGVFAHPEANVAWIAYLIDRHRYAEAAHFLSSRAFFPWEGSHVYRDLWVETWMDVWAQALERRDLQAALEAVERALEYPPNLGVGRGIYTNDAPQWWAKGVALKLLGRHEQAVEAWRQAACEPQKEWDVASYYKCLALRQLGESQKVDKLLNDMYADMTALTRTCDSAEIGAFLRALALRGLQKPEWRAAMQEAAAFPNMARMARRYLAGRGWDEMQEVWR
jgi:tetratricopeptide (TPR) repeat protein